MQRARGDKAGVAFLLRGIGSAYHQLREDANAETMIERGRAAYMELGNQKEAAVAVQILAQMRIDQERLGEAAVMLKQASELFDASHDKSDGALVRDDLAALYLRQSDYRSSLQLAFEALDIQRGLERDPFLQVSFERLANTLLAMEQPEKALGYYRQCLELRMKARDQLAIAQAYNNIGHTLERMGRHGDAMAALEQALELRRGRDNPEKIAETLINLGLAQESQGNHAKAEESYRAALKIAEERQYSSKLALALYGLGNLALEAGQIDDAIALHQRGLTIRQKMGDRILAVHSMNRLALGYERKGDLAQAEKLHATALAEFEKIAAGIADPAQVGRFRTSTVILYPHYARVLFKEGKTEEALAIAERSRGAGLARMAQTNRRGFEASLSEADRSAWLAAQKGRVQATNRLRDALAASAPPPAVDQRRSDYLRADNALEQLRDQIYARHPPLARPVAAEQGISKILEGSRQSPRTLYLEWLMVDETSTVLFAISQGAVRGFELPIGRAGVAAMAQQWRDSLEQGRTRGVAVAKTAPDPAVEQRTARALYAAILGPMAAELQKRTWSRIVLIPDGPLLDTPFAGLMNETGARLIEDFPITTAVSLESLFTARVLKPEIRTAFVVGDPIEAGERRVVAPSGDQFEPLVNARSEAKSVAGLFKNSLVLTGAQAREERVKQELSKYWIVHFATHGVLSKTDGDGLQSGLLLANELADGREDGLLQAWEIADMPLSAELAVLSACQTAEGDERLGEGLMGLAWAFQAAGCPNVVASLWNIDDEATQKLMTEFYRSIRAGKRVDDALRWAMLGVKSSAGTASPYYWAGFRILGPAGSL